MIATVQHSVSGIRRLAIFVAFLGSWRVGDFAATLGCGFATAPPVLYGAFGQIMIFAFVTFVGSWTAIAVALMLAGLASLTIHRPLLAGSTASLFVGLASLLLFHAVAGSPDSATLLFVLTAAVITTLLSMICFRLVREPGRMA